MDRLTAQEIHRSEGFKKKHRRNGHASLYDGVGGPLK